MPFLTHAKTTYTHGSLSLSIHCSVSLSYLSALFPILFHLLMNHMNTPLIWWEVINAINRCFIWGSLTINLIIVSFKTSLGPVLPPGSRNWQLIDPIKMIGLLVFGILAVDPKLGHQYVVVIFRGSPSRALWRGIRSKIGHQVIMS